MRITAITLFTVALYACDSSSPSTPLPHRDSGPTADAGMFDSSSPRPDATPVDSGPRPDAGFPADIGPRDAGPADDSLAGTSLENVQLRWDDALELCNVWRESRSLAEELDVKLQLTLQPHVRTSLARNQLAAASLSDGTLATGPLSNGKHALADRQWMSELTEWEVTDPAGNSRLSAAIEHRLGRVGTITERFSVYRDRGDPRDVVYGAAYEVEFWWTTPTGESAPLQRCDGGSELRPAVEVMAGASGTDSVTIVRYLNTVETFAGSYPVHLKSTQVILSDQPWMRHHVHGFWAQTYSAQHHNWEEMTRIDFAGDLGWYHAVFAPLARGEQPMVHGALRKVDLISVNGWNANAAIEVEPVQGQSRSYAVTERWVRVDEESLIRNLTCRGKDVITLGGTFDGYAIALLACRDNSAAGYALEAAVPILFNHDATQVGRYLDATNIIPLRGRPGYRIAVGRSAVEVETRANDQYVVKVTDSSGQRLLEAIERDVPFAYEGPRNNVLDRQSADGAVTAKIVRRWVGQGAGHSAIYAIPSFELSYDGATHRVDAWDAIEYTNTHHNWNDDLVAHDGDIDIYWRARFDINGGGLSEAVKIERAGVEVLPWTTVAPR